MSRKTLIICDLSDVLVKGLEGTEYGLSKKLNLPVEEVAEQLFTYDYRDLWYGTTSEEEFFSKLLNDLGWDTTLNELLAAIYENFYEIEGVRELYEELSHHHKLVLYSVNCAEWVKRIKKIVDYSDLFEKEFYSYDLKSHKKEPSGFNAIKSLYPHYEYYLIDDSSSNIRMAESLGITGLHFTSPEQLRGALKGKGLL